MLHMGSNSREFYAVFESFYRSRKNFIFMELSRFEISEKPRFSGSFKSIRECFVRSWPKNSHISYQIVLLTCLWLLQIIKSFKINRIILIFLRTSSKIFKKKSLKHICIFLLIFELPCCTWAQTQENFMLISNLFTNLENTLYSQNYDDLKFRKNRVFRVRSNRSGSVLFDHGQKTHIYPIRQSC